MDQDKHAQNMQQLGQNRPCGLGTALFQASSHTHIPACVVVGV